MMVTRPVNVVLQQSTTESYNITMDNDDGGGDGGLDYNAFDS
jgi:hypothetical protein